MCFSILQFRDLLRSTSRLVSNNELVSSELHTDKYWQLLVSVVWWCCSWGAIAWCSECSVMFLPPLISSPFPHSSPSHTHEHSEISTFLTGYQDNKYCAWNLGPTSACMFSVLQVMHMDMGPREPELTCPHSYNSPCCQCTDHVSVKYSGHDYCLANNEFPFPGGVGELIIHGNTGRWRMTCTCTHTLFSHFIYSTVVQSKGNGVEFKTGNAQHAVKHMTH